MVMSVRWLVVLLIALSCHNDPPPEEPVPVSSTGTPIGFLLDDHDLHLSTQQLGDVRGIDQILFKQLQDLDKANKKLGSANGGVPDTSPPPVQPIGRGRHRFQQANNGSGRRGGGGGNNAAAVDKLADERMELVRAAVVRVLTVLDPTQRERAKEVLSEHDIDLDVEAPVEPPQQANDQPPAMPRHHHHQPSGDDAAGESEQAAPPVQPEPQPPAPPQPEPQPAAPPPAPTPPPTIPPPTIPSPSQSAAPPPTIPPPSKAK
jgi:hypothetical protein